MSNQFLIYTEVPEDQPKEKFDFSLPEDVLIEIVGPHDDDPTNMKWDNWSIESCTVIKCDPEVTGAAQYDASYGAGLDYTISQHIACPGEGWWVIADITGQYHKGDGWMTDDDMTFTMSEARPATPEEIKLA